jgi:hypothetical protein
MNLQLVRAAGVGLLLGALPGASLGLQLPQGQVAELALELPLASDSLVFLQNPVGATRFGDSIIAVADGMAQTIHLFDSGGAYSGSVGRSGEGPNEFSTPGWLGRCGIDSATVWDFSLMRFTLLNGSGRIVDQRRLSDVMTVPRPPARLACSSNGHVMVLLRLGGERIPGRETSVLTAPLHLVSPGGDTKLILADAPVIGWLNEDRVYQPVSPTTHFAVSDSLIFLAASDSSRVRVHDLEGAFLRGWSLDVHTRPPTDEHVRRDAEKQAAFVPGAAARAEIVQRTMELPRPEHLPLHGGLRLDPSGRLWVITSIPGDPETVLQCYDANGTYIGTVEVPAAIEVFEVGESHIIGSRIDTRTMEPKVLLYEFNSGS